MQWKKAREDVTCCRSVRMGEAATAASPGLGMGDGASGEVVETQRVAPCGSLMHQVIAVTAKRAP